MTNSASRFSSSEQPSWRLGEGSGPAVVFIRGDWSLGHVQYLRGILPASAKERRPITIDGEALGSFDTVGALMLLKLAATLGAERIELSGFTSQKDAIFELVRSRAFQEREEDRGRKQVSAGFLSSVGERTLGVCRSFFHWLSFFGEAAAAILSSLVRPWLFRIRETFVQLDQTCIRAVPVVSLVTFLIGVVVAYLLAQQIQRYGASIFLVDGISIAMCRELAPIIVAVIVAGRSGSAFTAQIGAMKINEEVDALITLGLSPLRVLVLPRVCALMLAMPLLVFVGDVVGIAGGMAVAQSYLGLMPSTFLDRLQVVLAFKHVLIGLGKAPVFAFLIALIGCRMGLTVENNARSLGLQTTATVVQSIVGVILINAAFAALFAHLRI